MAYWNSDHTCQTSCSELTPNRTQSLNLVPRLQFTRQPGLPPATHQVTVKSNGLWLGLDLHSLSVPRYLTLQVLAKALKFFLNFFDLARASTFTFVLRREAKMGFHGSEQVELGILGWAPKESQDVWELLKQLWLWGMHPPQRPLKSQSVCGVRSPRSSVKSKRLVSKFWFLLLGKKKHCLRRRMNRNAPAEFKTWVFQSVPWLHGDPACTQNSNPGCYCFQIPGFSRKAEPVQPSSKALRLVSASYLWAGLHQRSNGPVPKGYD